MKKRVNFTIDPKLMAKARLLAHERSTSVSKLIEECLEYMVRSSHPDAVQFASKWAGKLNLKPLQPKDSRQVHLWNKYKLHEDSDRH